MEEQNTIVELIDENGSTVRFDLVMTFDYEGKRYAALLPVDEVEGVGEDEVVLWRIRGLGRLVDFLSANSLSVWALCAAAAAVCVILWLTAPRRRVRRMQEQMKKAFAACGAKYDREDENEDY